MEKMFLRILSLAFLVTLFACGGCRAIYKGVKDLVVAPEPVDSRAVAKFWNGPRIGPGMELIVQVGSPTVPAKQMGVMVDLKGEITLPYLLTSTVPCDNMTLEELRTKLTELYAGFIRQPQVTVTFGAYDGHGVSPWGTVTVMGEVGTQGPVNMPPTMDLTVTKVLQLAGGVKPYADTTRIVVTRCNEKGEQTKTVVDLSEIGEYGRFDKDMVLRAGDVVFVPQSWL